jgi:hypothetical protein
MKIKNCRHCGSIDIIKLMDSKPKVETTFFLCKRFDMLIPNKPKKVKVYQCQDCGELTYYRKPFTEHCELCFSECIHSKANHIDRED